MGLAGMGALAAGTLLGACEDGEEAAPRTPAPGATEPPTGEPVKVGSILDSTGPINIYGLPMVDATGFAIDDINANGGVLGRPLELIQRDGQSSNDKYVEFANELIVGQRVAVLMGGITSASREAVRPVVDREGIVYFYNEQYEGGVCDKFVFATGVVPTQQLKTTLIPWTLENVGKKVFTLAADYNYGQISADWVDVFLKEQGGEHVGVEFIPLDVTDFGAIINKVQAANPDAVMSLLVGGNHISFYRQFAAAGLKDKIKIVSPTLGLGNEQIVLSPEEGQGIVVAYPYYQELDNPTNRDFVQRWHERYGANYAYITDSACTVWNGWHLWAMAVNQAGSLETDKVIEALESGLEFDSPEGPIRLDPGSHHVVHSAHIAEVNDQQGFTISESFEGVEPAFEREVCDLIADPDQHTQFTP